jgi:hypothetical protein
VPPAPPGPTRGTCPSRLGRPPGVLAGDLSPGSRRVPRRPRGDQRVAGRTGRALLVSWRSGHRSTGRNSVALDETHSSTRTPNSCLRCAGERIGLQKRAVNCESADLARRGRRGELCGKPVVELRPRSLDGIWHDVGVAGERDLGGSRLVVGRRVTHEDGGDLGRDPGGVEPGCCGMATPHAGRWVEASSYPKHRWLGHTAPRCATSRLARCGGADRRAGRRAVGPGRSTPA